MEGDLNGRSGRTLIPVVILAVLILAVGIGTESSFAGKGFQPQKLTVIFSGDDLGNIKPCG